MFVLNIFIRTRPDPISMRFTTVERLRTAQGIAKAATAVVTISDDYGVEISVSEIICILAIDVAKEQVGAGEIALLNARATAKLNVKAAADPELMAAQRMNNLQGFGRQ